MVHNYIRLNETALDEPYMMTNQNELLVKVTTALWVSRLDLAKAFWQLPSSAESQKLFLIHTSVHLVTVLFR